MKLFAFKPDCFLVFCVILLFKFSTNAQTSTITIWKDSAIGAIYNKATYSVAYGKKNAKGIYKIYITDTLGQHETILTYHAWNADKHQWAEEWHPSGNYLFCYVEKPEYVPEKKHKRSSIDAIPGYGAYTDLWLITRDGKQAWQLTHLPNRYSSGIIHSAISDDGKLFAWSERIGEPKFTSKNLAAGSYVMKVADFVFDSVPALKNIRTFQPGGIPALNELESFSKDNTTLLFYSSFETKNIINTPIYALNINTGDIKKLTEGSFSQAPVYTPDGNHIVYMTGKDCDIFPLQLQGADWWIMNPDGTNNMRLTFMNKWNHLQSVNKFRLAGSVSFISNNSFFGGVMTKSLGLTGHTVKVSFSTPTK